MNKHDSEDDFLANLYKQSANEKPPIELDKKVLALAKTQHQRRRYAKTINLQRLLSVAAAMVFSMYIFFDVGQEHSAHFDDALFHTQPKSLKSSPPALQTEDLEMSDEAQMPSRLKKHESKPSVEKDMTDKVHDKISESAAEALEQSTNEIAMPKLLLAPKPASKNLLNERTEDSVSAEEQLTEIQRLLVEGKIDEAKQAYEKFKMLFPDYPIPRKLIDAIEHDLHPK